jgi:hypothetical protein
MFELSCELSMPYHRLLSDSSKHQGRASAYASKKKVKGHCLDLTATWKEMNHFLRYYCVSERHIDLEEKCLDVTP